jgi:hypothetical protein
VQCEGVSVHSDGEDTVEQVRQDCSVVQPYHKTVVVVNASSARVTEGVPINNTHSLCSVVQQHT